MAKVLVYCGTTTPGAALEAGAEELVAGAAAPSGAMVVS